MAAEYIEDRYSCSWYLIRCKLTVNATEPVMKMVFDFTKKINHLCLNLKSTHQTMRILKL